LGPGVQVVVETLEEIPRSAAGKFQAVVSLINRGESSSGLEAARGLS
jgi:hypothetical protein